MAVENCETFCWFCALEVKAATTLQKMHVFQLYGADIH